MRKGRKEIVKIMKNIITAIKLCELGSELCALAVKKELFYD